MKSVAIIGSGPAALMAASVVAQAGHKVGIYEKRPGPAWKLFVAGSSGLNITNHLPVLEFAKHFLGPPQLWQSLISDFSPTHWLEFIENLGLKTFKGSGGRYFVETMHAAQLVRQWRRQLTDLGVQWHFGHECVDFDSTLQVKFIKSGAEVSQTFDAICFALGGGSYEPNETPLRWPTIFKNKGIGFDDFSASNVGYQIKWSAEFLKEAEGLPLKNVVLSSAKGSRRGDIVITNYGLEGTPVYFVGLSGDLKLDLKPDLTKEQMLAKCQTIKENLAPYRRVQKLLTLGEGIEALVFHHAPKDVLSNLNDLLEFIKSFPLTFLKPQPLSEAISSAGGVHMNECDDSLMLKRFPGVFVAGEMLNWDAPTGGFLIQGSVSQGYRVGKTISSLLVKS